MYEQIINQLEQLLKQEVQNFAGDFAKSEKLVWQTILSLGHGLLQRIVDSQLNGYQKTYLACPCGGWMKFVQHRSRNIHSILGWIRLKWAYYRCPDCGATLAPYDKASGLGSQQLSPALAQACCMLAVDESFEQVSKKIQHLFGQRVCDDTIEQVVHHVGKVILQQQQQELNSFFENRQIPAAQANPHRLYVAADGTSVHEKDGWHEAKTGCIWWEDERFEAGKRYVASFQDSQQFGWHLWMEACKCGLPEAEELVYLGDGAGWVRSEHDRHFKRAVFIIDWYHACEHVWGCGKALFGEGTAATEQWIEEHLSLLWDGWTKRLLRELAQEAKRYRTGKKKAIEDLHHYILVNEQQMRYDVFRSQGYDIGSGAVEGACGYVVGDRLKDSGMIWSRAGSSAMLALRTTWLNGQWEEWHEDKR